MKRNILVALIFSTFLIIADILIPPVFAEGLISQSAIPVEIERARIDFLLLRRQFPGLEIKYFRLKNTNPAGFFNTISALKSDQGRAFLDLNSNRLMYLDKRENIALIMDIFTTLEITEAGDKTAFKELYFRIFPDAMGLKILRFKNADLVAVNNKLNELKSDLGRVQVDNISKQVLMIDTIPHMNRSQSAILSLEEEQKVPQSS